MYWIRSIFVWEINERFNDIHELLFAIYLR